MYQYYNPNPRKLSVGDCVIRAISKAFDYGWDKAYTAIAIQGYMMCDIPSSDSVWGAYLLHNGFTRHTVPECPDCYTVSAFAEEHPEGTYVIKTSGHVVTVKNGSYFDSWDSGNEVVIYYYQKKDGE